jgi:hypothetical protein
LNGVGEKIYLIDVSVEYLLLIQFIDSITLTNMSVLCICPNVLIGMTDQGIVRLPVTEDDKCLDCGRLLFIRVRSVYSNLIKCKCIVSTCNAFFFCDVCDGFIPHAGSEEMRPETAIHVRRGQLLVRLYSQIVERKNLERTFVQFQQTNE